MHSGTHSDAAPPPIFAKRALHANAIFWRSHGTRVWRKCVAAQRRNANAASPPIFAKRALMR
eukprot:11176930-Lingulodinium_polyedra.AAC.1